MSFAAAERAAICDTFLEVGPDAPTLNEGWDAYDLAAHLWVRENRVGMRMLVMIDPKRAEETLLRAAKQENSFLRLISLLREGPKGASIFRLPGVEHLANTAELFIHHEDLRRAGPSPLPPRELDEEATKALTGSLRRMAGLMFRKAPFGVDLTIPGGETIAVKRRRKVGIRGEAGELLLWASGRTGAAHVELAGRPEDVAELKASLGI
ncbi:MAG: TIGR03085 family metal-binding protein [bacterium]|nr:TIGR03085 family metal-binding protein [bacterium]